MLITEIYQTLENRNNDREVEKHGPYFCSLYNKYGKLKRGVKEPWLGEGYYFWDTRKDDALWWGDNVYKYSGYVVCKTTYDQHSPFLFDLLGITRHFDEFVNCTKKIKDENKLDTIKVPVVIAYLKKRKDFIYRAIRVWPNPKTMIDLGIEFPGNRISLNMIDKVQICFFDNSLLNDNFIIVDKNVVSQYQTI